MGASLRGDIRTTLLQAIAFLDSASAPAGHGWRHADRALLQGQGDASSGFAPVFKSTMIPSMGDLQSRLEREGARFLDIGVGVASLSIAMCRAFPALRVLGVDKYDLPLSIARENIGRAGLEGRIELTETAIEALDQEAAFDLAWLPTVFIAEPALAAATARVCRALRPGGWILYPTGTNPAASAKGRAVSGLVTHLWGGPALSIERGSALLEEAGFTSVRALPGPPWAPAMLVGQRPL
jgi:SAM-dependent methyltransferase